MAIMVTDPRNNLLSQLTAVGQQYLAGKQQERMSATEFSNKKALIELMDRLGGQADVREFGQQKETMQLGADLQERLSSAEGQRALAALGITTASNERVAQIGATGQERAAAAGKPAPQVPFDPVNALTRILPLLQSGGAPVGPGPEIDNDFAKVVVDLGGESGLRNVRGAWNDPAALESLLTEAEGNPVGTFLSSPFTGGKANEKFQSTLRDRLRFLKEQGASIESNNLNRENLAGAAQLLQALFSTQR